MARCSMTELSLPIEYSITGRSLSATASRMIWMLSASRRSRWVSRFTTASHRSGQRGQRDVGQRGVAHQQVWQPWVGEAVAQR